jgi:DNA ligase 1
MFISPMLLHKSEHPFDDPEYITELKLDGIRLILSKMDNKIRLYTRHNNEVTSRFPELLNIDIPDGTVLDGELVVTDSQGKPDFEAMMGRFQSNKVTHAVQYCVFDIIYYKGMKVTNLPLIERKSLLESYIPQSETVALVQWMYGNGEAYFNLTKQHDLEGIVLKKAKSKYQINKRSHDWLKVINYQYEDCFITGIRKGEFGVLLGKEENNRMINVGVMEYVPPEARKQLYRHYKGLVTKETNDWTYLEPKLQCKVKYRNLTKKGLLRIPSFIEYIEEPLSV